MTSTPRPGSPPCIRGKLPEWSGSLWRHGLTPAHTGKTLCWKLASWRGWAHPRAYGENLSYLENQPNNQGSSPRIRGKQLRHATTISSGGLTPAHTGKTFGCLDLTSGSWAHPRAYRENLIFSFSAVIALGSPPRIRGKRCRRGCHGRLYGLIPAHTGKTEY